MLLWQRRITQYPFSLVCQGRKGSRHKNKLFQNILCRLHGAHLQSFAGTVTPWRPIPLTSSGRSMAGPIAVSPAPGFFGFCFFPDLQDSSLSVLPGTGTLRPELSSRLRSHTSLPKVYSSCKDYLSLIPRHPQHRPMMELYCYSLQGLPSHLLP